MDVDNEEALQTLKKHEEDLNNLRSKQAELEKTLKNIDQECKQKKMEFGRLENAVKDHEEHMQGYNHELGITEKDKRKFQKEQQSLVKRLNAMQTEYDFTRKKRDGLKDDLENQKEYAETKRQRLTEQEKEIEDKIREKKILDKQNVQAKVTEQDSESQYQTLKNEQMKLQMKLLGFKNELEKLQKNMWVLESDRDKYCVEASKANKNYY